MKSKRLKRKSKGIAERKTAPKRAESRRPPYRSLAIALLLWLTTIWLFFGNGIVRPLNLVEGQRIPSTILASVNFDCEILAETELNRNKAADAVPPVFTLDSAPQERAMAIIEKLFDRIARLDTGTNDRHVIVNSMDDLLLGSSVKGEELARAFSIDKLKILPDALLRNVRETMSGGILSDKYRMSLFRGRPDRKLTIVGPEGATTLPLSQIPSARRAVDAIIPSDVTTQQRRLLEQLLPFLVTDNLIYDREATKLRRAKAAEAVPPVIRQYAVGTPLVHAGDATTRQDLLLLRRHEQKRQEEKEGIEQIMEVVGNGILLLAGLIAATVILNIAAPGLTRRPDRMLLLALLSLLAPAVARLLTRLGLQHSLVPAAVLAYLVPYGLSVLPAAILLDGIAAIVVGFWVSFATAVLLDQSFGVFALGILVAATAAATARNIHRRASLFRAGLWVCGVKVLIVLVAAILNRPVLLVVAEQLAAAVLSGMLSTIVVLLLIPLFEKLFHITTDITLLELSDMGHPLLQRLAMQAPGTYHHSLMVATLAQNAAEAIGANALLARVCAYYHDIGKLAKPEYFTENIQRMENPHDELAPQMSALIIVSHVKEGLALAKRNKLPKPIRDAIEQHHGNGLISFFYHKARKLREKETAAGESADPVNDADFRYGGAAAVSPEMTILALADAVEAASRSIEKPTPGKIERLVDEIFDAKMRDGQLDRSALTLAKIAAVRDSFVFSLVNMLHGRIPYPKADERRNDQSTADSPAD